MLRNYRDLTAWQKACQVCLDVYRISRKLPASEKYGLPSQMRRAAVSVPSNIAEGYSRSSTGDYIRGLRIAYASNSELETQVMLARDLCLMFGIVLWTILHAEQAIRQYNEGSGPVI